MQLLIGFLIFIVFMFVLVVGTAIMRMRKVRWMERTYYQSLDEDAVDPLISDIMQAKSEELTAWGFEPAWWVSVAEPYFVDDRRTTYRVLFHPESQTYAQLALHPLPEAGESVSVDFISFYPGQQVSYSSNCTEHFMGVELEGYDWGDPYSATLQEHWSFHQQRLKHYQQPAITLTREEFCNWGNRFIQQYQAGLKANGDLYRTQQGTGRLTYAGAWRAFKRIQAGQKRLRPILMERRKSAADAMNSEVEVLAHQRQEAMLGNQPASVKGKLTVLIVSAVLFMLSFGFRMDIQGLIILVAVLFFHEMGHVVAMRMFAYKDLKILFIPFLGAVATGKKTSCPAWQSAVIYLAGPVPGIILAMALLLIGHEFIGIWAGLTWMPTLVAMLLFINFFNLLPIQPLDGGQLANVLIFQRWPKLQIVFFGVSVAAFMAMAWWLEEPLLAGVGFLIGFTMLYQYREASLLNHIRKHYPGLGHADKQDQLLAIYRSIKELGIHWPYGTRHQAAKNILDRVGAPLPRVKETAAGLGLYLVLLIALPLVFLQTGFHPGATSTSNLSSSFLANSYLNGEEEAPDWQALLDSANDDEEKLSVLQNALDYYDYSDSPELVLDYGRQAREILVRTGQAESVAMADVILQMAGVRLDYDDELSPGALQNLLSKDIAPAIEIYERQEPDDTLSWHLAAAYELKGRVEEMLGGNEAALASMQAANVYWLKFPEDLAWEIIGNLETQARLYVSLGDYRSAETRYLDALDWVKNHAVYDNAYLTNSTLKSLTGFYLDQQQYQSALDAIAQQVEMEDSYGYYIINFAEMQGWAHFKQAQYDTAIVQFERAIAAIDQQRLDYPKSKRGYDKADNFSRLLLVHHLQGQSAEPTEMDSRADTDGGDGVQVENRYRVAGETDEVAADIVSLLTELEATEHTVEDYLKHLECECNRHAGGYRLDQSESMRDVINRYLNTRGNSL